MKLSLDFRNRCESIAVNERRKIGLQAFDALAGEALAEIYQIMIVTPDDLTVLAPEIKKAFLEQDQIWGFLLRIAELTPFIIVHPQQPRARLQSTLMHELSHFLLSHGNDDLVALLSGEKRNEQQEKEATYLGGCLQIPKIGLKLAWQTGLSITQTMARFNASESMVRYRCNMTGIRLKPDH